MKAYRVIIENFFTIKKLDLPLMDKGVHLIVGKNGTGKSTILQALKWGPFGSTTEKLKADEVINNQIKKNCKVHTFYKKGKIDYEIIRYRKYDKICNSKKKEVVKLLRNGNEIEDPETEIAKLFATARCHP